MGHAERRRPPICRLPVVMAICLLGGCAFDTPPKIEVESIRCVTVSQSDPTYVELGVNLLLENPTEKPIQLETFEYSVSVGPTRRWSGSWSALRTLPANETVRMHLPAVVEDPFTGESEGTSWRVSGTISYKAPGRLAQILFDTGFRRPTHDFEGRGNSIPPPEASADLDSPSAATDPPDA